MVNKTGSLAAALAAARAGVPVYAVAALDKIDPGGRVHGETGDAACLYAGSAELTLHLPVFERVPAELIAGLVTEEGVLGAGDVALHVRLLADLRHRD